MAGIAKKGREQARIPSYVIIHMIYYVTIRLNDYVIVYVPHYLTSLNQILNRIRTPCPPPMSPYVTLRYVVTFIHRP